MAPAYRTVFEPAVMVIAGVITITLLTKERYAVYKRKGDEPREVVVREERQRTQDEWQLSWQNETRGRLIARLIGNLAAWLNRKHGEADYFLTQFLTGHEGFQSYLYNIGKARSPDCVFCNGVVDDANTLFFLWKVGPYRPRQFGFLFLTRRGHQKLGYLDSLVFSKPLLLLVEKRIDDRSEFITAELLQEFRDSLGLFSSKIFLLTISDNITNAFSRTWIICLGTSKGLATVKGSLYGAVIFEVLIHLQENLDNQISR